MNKGEWLRGRDQQRRPMLATVAVSNRYASRRSPFYMGLSEEVRPTLCSQKMSSDSFYYTPHIFTEYSSPYLAAFLYYLFTYG